MLRLFARTGIFSLDSLLSHVRVPLYRNAYALMFSTVATSGLGMIYWIVAARYYTAETVGLNATLVSMLTFLAGAAQAPSMNAVLRFVPVAGSDTRRLIICAYLFSAAFATLIGIMFVLSVDIVSPALRILSNEGWLALWFIMGVVAWCIFMLQDNVLTGLRETFFVPIENIPYSLAKIGLLLFFAASLPRYGILASWTVPLVVVMIPVNYLLFRTLIPRHIQAAKNLRFTFGLRQIAYYVAGNYFGALFLLAATRLLPVLVTNLAGASATAYFYLPWTIAISLRLLTANLNTSFTVELAADNSKLGVYSYRILVHTIGMLALPVGLLLIAGPFVLRLSGLRYAEEGTTLIRLLALAALPNAIVSLYLGIARVRQQVSGIIVVQFGLCVLTLGLSYVLVRFYGITGVGIAVLGSEIIVALALLITSLWPILSAPLLHNWVSIAGRHFRFGEIQNK